MSRRSARASLTRPSSTSTSAFCKSNPGLDGSIVEGRIDDGKRVGRAAEIDQHVRHIPHGDGRERIDRTGDLHGFERQGSRVRQKSHR
jgi:hypothetical protein